MNKMEEVKKFSLKKLAVIAQRVKQNADDKLSNVNRYSTVSVDRHNYSKTILLENESKMLFYMNDYIKSISVYYELREIISSENNKMGISGIMAKINRNNAIISAYESFSALKGNNEPSIDSVYLFFRDALLDKNPNDLGRMFYLSTSSDKTIDVANKGILAVKKENDELSDALSSLNSDRRIILPENIMKFLLDENII
jgi:hypothetical protein